MLALEEVLAMQMNAEDHSFITSSSLAFSTCPASDNHLGGITAIESLDADAEQWQSSNTSPRGPGPFTLSPSLEASSSNIGSWSNYTEISVKGGVGPRIISNAVPGGSLSFKQEDH
jgi:hypothetical protein